MRLQMKALESPNCSICSSSHILHPHFLWWCGSSFKRSSWKSKWALTPQIPYLPSLWDPGLLYAKRKRNTQCFFLFCPLLLCFSLKGRFRKKQNRLLLLPLFNRIGITKDYTPINCITMKKKKCNSAPHSPETHPLPAEWDQRPRHPLLSFYETVLII